VERARQIVNEAQAAGPKAAEDAEALFEAEASVEHKEKL
jgi:hypothetical protein